MAIHLLDHKMELPGKLLMCCSLHQGVYVPIGGKQLINFMDDFNMPAKDTFGSQPPLELIRLWLDYGFWYDRQKQTVKYIKVSQIAVSRDIDLVYASK